MGKLIRSLLAASLVSFLLPAAAAMAESAEVIDARVDTAIQAFKEEVNGADVFLSQSAGYLVFVSAMQCARQVRRPLEESF